MPRHSLRRRALQALKVSTTLLVLGVAVIGFAHTQYGRPLLRYIPGMGACPLDAAPLTIADRARVRATLLAPLAGEHAAASRRVFDFELGSTTAAEVSAWSATHGLACESGRKLALRCTKSPTGSFGLDTAFDEVAFDFDAGGRLVTVEGSANLGDAARVANYVEARDQTLRDRLGPPTTIRGEARPEVVTVGPLSQIFREFRSSDVRAQIVATNRGRGRFTIREYYQLIAG